ncbi:hypothetical protein [Luteimicrobium subarcticum]|uniref:Uncharacterized protein n=1 Tax=Luteimicrobium subarcticum TaxID=620910 RepID=A0A2M8WRX5_9MICO|nr:hypothetical protein [Luteimicrobium subarcticum]PJI93668.1 hypothetical protein CLV34_1142 [Luteimicrobium subarcticum]
MFGDVLENLTASDLELTAGTRRSLDNGLLTSTPTNQEVLDATRTFYQANHATVDLSAKNSTSVAEDHKSYVDTMGGYKDALRDKSLPPGSTSTTQQALFGDDSDDDGLFGPTLDKVKAEDLFTTIALGVSVEAIFFVGGMGGAGCAWDIAKREPPSGYGYATGELGFKVAADVNVQVAIFNELPSQLDHDVFGLNVTLAAALSLGFSTFFTMKDSKLTVLGYAVAVGVGVGAGAAVFGGHLWNFR